MNPKDLDTLIQQWHRDTNQINEGINAAFKAAQDFGYVVVRVPKDKMMSTKLISLEELMRQFAAGELSDEIAFISGFGSGIANVRPQFNLLVDQFGPVRGRIANLHRLLLEAGLPVTAIWVSRVLTELDSCAAGADGTRSYQGHQKQQLEAYLMQIVNGLGTEMQTKLFLSVPFEKAPWLEQSEPLFGTEVDAKFPSLAYDISEAGKCFAVERSTAAVFHAIRCLEAGFAAIWRCLGIADPIAGFERNWSNRVKKVQAQVDLRWPQSTGRITGDAQIFDSLVGALMAMQNPYRNTTMHFDQKYNEDEAAHIIEMVKGLMQRIASRMDEAGLPLA